MMQKLSANLEQDEGRGTRDEEKWEGEAPTKLKLIGKSAGRQMGKSEGQK
jgi:hypothetical protein